MIGLKFADYTDPELNLFIDFMAEPFSVLIYGQDKGEITSRCIGRAGNFIMDGHRCGSHFVQGTNLPFENWVVIHKIILEYVSKG